MNLAKSIKAVLSLLIFLLVFNCSSLSTSAKSVNLLPFEDEKSGRNSNAYLSTQEYPSTKMKEDFINEISTYAMKANEQWGIPASAIIGMAALESGYGTTRIAVNANNLFGVKVWGYNPKNAWQLKGQPDEDYEPVPVLKDFGEDRKIYDESKRRDNWYRAFSSYKEAVEYLAGNLLLNDRYRFAKTNYEERMKKGWDYERASKEYLFDIANAGYIHLGGEYYRSKVGVIMDERNLYQFDDRKLKDIGGHWAEQQILFLTEKGWISGYPDGTYKPNQSITRAQAAAIISNFLSLTTTNKDISFTDVENSFWAADSIRLVAQHKIINGIGDGRFSPNTYLTRAQMAQIFYNAGFYSQPANKGVNSFKDVDYNFWASLAIETMKQEGIMAGYSAIRFGPNNPTTRAHMAAMIYRIHEKGLNK